MLLAESTVTFDTGVFITLLALGGTAVLTLVGWVLTQVVTLGRLISGLEARMKADSEEQDRRLAEHDRRFAELELRRGAAG